MPAGPIAREVVQALTASPLPVVPIQPVPTVPAPGSEGSSTGPPMRTVEANTATPWSGRWWFEKGGPLGVVCFLLIGAFAFMGNSQRDSTNALIQSQQDQQKAAAEERRELTKMLMNTQSEISANMARMSRSLERLEAQLVKKE